LHFVSSTPAEPPQAQGGASSEAVDNVVAMGFPREEAQAALRAAFGDVNRAIQYLTSVMHNPNAKTEIRAGPPSIFPLSHSSFFDMTSLAFCPRAILACAGHGHQ
jgi:uncharacterized UBP type Zn finger protein